MVGRWSSPTLWQLLALGATLLLTTQAAVADPSPADIRRGMIFVRVHCSQCHAIGKLGESPLASAPPFRTLQISIRLQTCSALCSRNSPGDAAISAHSQSGVGRCGLFQVVRALEALRV